MKRCLFITACLLASVPAMASGGADMFGPSYEGVDRKPTRFVRVEAVGFGWMGLTDSPAIWVRLLSGTCIIDRYRVGLSFTEGVGMFDIWGGGMTLPIQLGYTLWSHRVGTWFLYSSMPDLYAEVSIGLWDEALRYGPGARLSLCCDVDFIGLGARLEAGWFTVHCDEGQLARKSSFYAGAQVRLLTFGIGF